MSNTTILTPGQRIRPNADSNEAKRLVQNLYGLSVQNIHELNAYDDNNFHVLCRKESNNPHIRQVHDSGYVLKITNSLDSKKIDLLEAQNDMVIYLNKNGIVCPLPVRNIKGTYYSLENLSDGNEKYVVRLFLYRPGPILHQVPITRTLLLNLGLFAVKLDKILAGFYHAAYDNHETLWMMTNVPSVRKFAYVLEEPKERKLVNVIITEFEKNVLERIDEFDKGIIHGDLNSQNIVLNSDGTEITAILDFGDAQKSCLVFELVVALTYAILQARDIDMGRYVLQGYESARKLTDLEKKVLKVGVCARLCQSLVMGVYSHTKDPQNEYLLSTQRSGWTILNKLWPMSESDVFRVWGLTS